MEKDDGGWHDVKYKNARKKTKNAGEKKEDIKSAESRKVTDDIIDEKRMALEKRKKIDLHNKPFGFSIEEAKEILQKVLKPPPEWEFTVITGKGRYILKPAVKEALENDGYRVRDDSNNKGRLLVKLKKK